MQDASDVHEKEREPKTRRGWGEVRIIYTIRLACSMFPSVNWFKALKETTGSGYEETMLSDEARDILWVMSFGGGKCLFVQLNVRMMRQGIGHSAENRTSQGSIHSV